MIKRYECKNISTIWSQESTLKRWKEIEVNHLSTLWSNKMITTIELEEIINNIKIDSVRWKEIESETKHDLQAFVQMLEESIGGDSGRWIHYGLTSSDIVDTSNSLACIASLRYCLIQSADVIPHLSRLIDSFGSVRILARTHGRVAEITNLEQLFLRWRHLLEDAEHACSAGIHKVAIGKLSGPCGNNSTLPDHFEEETLQRLDLRKSNATSQIISRQHYLDYFYGLLKVCVAYEKIAYDIRHYSIEGIDEMAEGFTKGQKGSSAMPHKKNPVLTENLCGLARLGKSYFQAAVDNCNTLFERDISHSSAERVIFEDMAHVASFGLERLCAVLSNLEIKVDNIKSNVDKVEHLVSSQREMNELIRSGLTRKQAHDKIQLNKNYLQ